jgi:hypothetical protein
MYGMTVRTKSQIGELRLTQTIQYQWELTSRVRQQEDKKDISKKISN